MSTVTHALMRRSSELALAHVQPQTKEPHGGLVALFVISAVLLSLAFWAVSNTMMP